VVFDCNILSLLYSSTCVPVFLYLSIKTPIFFS
jgi:hypothetical protein